MNTSEKKIKLIEHIDSLNKNELDEFYGMYLNFVHTKDNMNNWNELSKEQKDGIKHGIYELDSDQGIPNKQVMEELRKKYGIS